MKETIEITPKEIGKTLRRLRGDNNAAETAKYCGISRTMLNLYENGQRCPGVPALSTLARHFNVNLILKIDGMTIL